MKTLIALSAGLLLLGSAAAVAGQPENPGQFGRDRAAAIQGFQENPAAPGASEWGHEASKRAGDNGEMNRDYKDSVGGSPTSKGNDK